MAAQLGCSQSVAEDGSVCPHLWVCCVVEGWGTKLMDVLLWYLRTRSHNTRYKKLRILVSTVFSIY